MPKKNKPATGIRAETDFVVGMGGKYYKGGAGSQATDIIMTHPEHGDLNTEMKAGPTVDHQQMRMDVDAVSGNLRQTVRSQQMSGDVASGKIHPVTGKIRNILGLINRPFRGVTLKSGQQTIERPSRTKTDPETGNPLMKQEKRPASMQQLDQASTKRLSMNNKNGVSMMHMGDDHVHVAIHHTTGEVALIPTSNDHAHIGDKMGLSKTITYDHFGGDDHGHKKTLGLTLRGARAKGSTVNVSLETSSGNMVDAVRDAGGHVFDSLDHATEHLRSHGWTAKSGHAMSESIGLLLQGKYEEKLLIEGMALDLLGDIYDGMRKDKKEDDPAATDTQPATGTQPATDTQPTDPFSAPPWPGGKDGAPPPIWGGNQEDNPYKDWNQDADGNWVKMPASAAPEPTGTETPAPDFSFTPQEKDPSGGLRNRQAERQSEDSTKTGQQHIGFQPRTEGIEKMFSDFLKEKNIELNAVGMLGGEILKNPKKKKVEESAMLMMMPILHKMQNESRNTINTITQSQGNSDGR